MSSCSAVGAKSRGTSAGRRGVPPCGVRGRPRKRRQGRVRCLRPARRRTSSGSETARRTGSARRAARPSARSGPCGRPASSSPGRTGPLAVCSFGTVDSRRAAQLVVADVGIEQHGTEPAVALNDPVDGVALRLEHVVETIRRPASDCGRGACRTCRRLGRACRATPGAGSTPARGDGEGAPSCAPGRLTRCAHCGTGSAGSCR